MLSIIYTLFIKIFRKVLRNIYYWLVSFLKKNHTVNKIHYKFYRPEFLQTTHFANYFPYLKFTVSSYYNYILKKKISLNMNLENAEISIIIPIYKKRFNLFRCLESLSKSNLKLPFEVIIIDDFPNAKKPFFIDDQIKYIKNVSNLGFLKSCNKGSEKANGKFFYFLNDDTIILNEKTILKLYQRIKSDDFIGIVGSKVLYPNLLIQEAGCVTFSDGNCYQIGNLQNKHQDDYNYYKEVNYVSGCSLFIRAKLFFKTKFDEMYMPGYYEDVDLAFTVRKENYKVVYEPESEIIHCEGSSAGTDLNVGMKRFQNINKEKFFRKWENYLINNLIRSNISSLDASFLNQRIIIFIDDLLPDENRDAGSFIPLFLIKYYQEKKFQICFFIKEINLDDKNIKNLQNQGVRVIYFEKSLLNIVSKMKNSIDAVVLLRPKNLQRYQSILNQLNIKIIYHFVDLHFLRLEREKKFNSRTLENIDEIKKIETNLVRKNFINLTCSKFEYQILVNNYNINNVIYLPLFYPNQGYKNYNIKASDVKKLNLVFLGSTNHMPNMDAIENFIQNILPLIDKKISTCLHLVGLNNVKLNKYSHNNNIIMHGSVGDLYSIFKKIDIAISPLRYGAGAKGKIISYAMYSLPVICSDISIEGTEFLNKEHLIISDPNSYQTYANDIYDLFMNKKLMLKLSQNIYSKFVNSLTFEKGIKDLNSFKEFEKLRIKN